MSYVNLQQGSTQGRPNLFQGSGPGTGKFSGGSGNKTAAAGGFPFGNMNPNRVVNQTMGFQTNPTINYAYIIRRFKSGFDQALNQGQIVFIRKCQPPVGSRLYTMLNLPQMNFMLLKMAEMGGGEDTVENILAEWDVMGVIQGEVGGDLRDQPQERLLNVTVSGRARMFNVFGKNCQDGTALYMLLKEKTVQRTDVALSCTLALNGSTESVLLRDEATYLQFEPCGNCLKPPRVGQDETKAILYMGRVSRNSKASSAPGGALVESVTNIQRMVTLPMVEVFLDYSTADVLGGGDSYDDEYADY